MARAASAVDVDLDDARSGPETSDTAVRILEAGVACIARFGNEKTSIHDVANEAGVSRGTIYRYFEDRATLFAAISRYEGEREASAIRARIAGAKTLEQALAAVVEERVIGALRYHTREHLRRHDRGFAEFFVFGQRRHLDAARKIVEPLVRTADAAAELAPGVTVPEAVDWIVISMSTVVPLTEAASFDVDDPAATGRFYARFMCRGLTVDGH